MKDTGKIDLTGMEFGRLTVLGRAEVDPNRKQQRYWKCLCSCGKTTIVPTYQLNSGKTQSCGCLQRDVTIERNFNRVQNREDIIGRQFGRLTVLGPSCDGLRGLCFLRCKCSCGAEKIVSYSALMSGLIKSCGCQLTEYQHSYKRTNFVDITGQRFGKLIAVQETVRRHGKSVIWECKCDCGRTSYASLGALKSGEITSCGLCGNKSKGELRIAQLLDERKIHYEHEATFDACRFPDTHRMARFDFYVDNSYIIEYDGNQHFNSERGSWGNESYLEVQREHDIYKNQWCLENQLPIIRIPYTRYESLCIEDIMLETTDFLVKDTPVSNWADEIK